MRRIVALDTNILTWALKNKATLGQERMIPLCQTFLSWLDDNEDIILIPEIVVSELLMDLPEDQHTAFLMVLDERGFVTQPHDRQASLIAARMWRKARQPAENTHQTASISRKQLRVDTLVLAAAVSGQASVFYTNNTRDFVRFSEGFSIQISDIPKEEEMKPPQLPLFVGEESSSAQAQTPEENDDEKRDEPET